MVFNSFANIKDSALSKQLILLNSHTSAKEDFRLRVWYFHQKRNCHYDLTIGAVLPRSCRQEPLCGHACGAVPTATGRKQSFTDETKLTDGKMDVCGYQGCVTDDIYWQSSIKRGLLSRRPHLSCQLCLCQKNGWEKRGSSRVFR